MSTKAVVAERSPIEFHQGDTLLRLAGHYPTLLEVILEGIQNCIDEGARNIRITLNQKRRTASISDDGEGASKAKFEEALTSICSSVKKKGKMGKFGMGLISPLGKCEEFTFTSTPKNNPRGYLSWTFNTEEITNQRDIEGIPVVNVPDLYFEREGKGGGVSWRTQVKIRNFTTDHVISRVTLSSLREGILEKYAVAMRENGVTVSTEITDINAVKTEDKIVADDFDGKRLPVEYDKYEASGRTTFRLFLANKTSKGRVGKVSIGEDGDDFRISFGAFAKDASSLLDRDVYEALTSGVFEGEILSEKAKLDPTRRFFQHNDALVDLCIVIKNWYNRIGKEHMLRIREEQQDNRYQQLGIRSMQVIEGMLGTPEFGHLQKVIKSFSVGTTGEHHTKPNAKLLGLQSSPSISTDGRKKEATPKTGSGGSASGEGQEKDHTPFTVSGPKGRKRTLVRGNSLGLQFAYEEMEGLGKSWVFNNVTGVLSFNTRHPHWERCEIDDKVLMRFQEHIAITALSLETVPKDWQERHRQFIDDSTPSFVFWLLQGDELSGRKPGSSLAKYRERKKRAKAS